MWGLCFGYGFKHEERRCSRKCREAADGFGAILDGVDIVQDRLGPKVVGDRLVLACGASLEREHGRGHVHGVP